MTPIAEYCYANLLALGEPLAAHRGCALSTISRMACNDPPTLDRLKAGKGSMTIRKYDAAIAWFLLNWPSNLPMPKLHDPFGGASPVKKLAVGATLRRNRRRTAKG